MPAVGDHLGSYEIIRAIGAGGMGEVYLARDTRLGRLAAIKILPPALAADDEHVQRFTQEAQLASSLNHPGIATVYDIGETGGVRFIAMEYVDGETLSHRLQREALPTATVIDIGIQAAEALRAAHESGITHRDIKPDNLMIRPDGLVKVLDFGLAKLTSPSMPIAGDAATIEAGLTRAGVVMGTVHYMSPEQARGQTVDQRTDIFSLGVVLFEAATNRRPFTGETAMDVAAAILNRDAVAPSQHTATLPAEFDRIVRKTLRKSPGERYSSSQDLLNDLKALRRDLDVSAITAARPSPSPRFATWIAATAAVIVVLTGGLSFFRRAESTPSGRSIVSVAVLPFIHSGGDPNMAYLADGLAESVTNNLSRLPGLRVMPRSTAARYRATKDPRQAGRDLDVQAVLVGTVDPRGEVVTINLELIDVEDGRQLWGQQYPRPLSDLVRLQSDISSDVAKSLQPRLSGDEQQHLTQLPTSNSDAYQLYLRGQFYAHQVTEEGLRTAVDYFTQALEKDPQFVQAHLGLAEAYIAQGVDFLPAREVMPKATAHAVRALELKPDSPDAHAALGIVKLVYDWDWKGAQQELSQAHAIDSPAIESFSCALHYADPLGRNQDAIAALQSAVAAEPQSLPSNLELGCASYYGRRYDQAVRQFRGTLALYPNHAGALFYLGRALVQQDQLPTAIAQLQDAKRSSADWPPIVSELGYANARAGHRKEALAALEELRVQSAHRFVDPYLLAAVHMGLGDKNATIAALHHAVEERSGWLPWLKVEPKWDPLHGDARFNELLRRVGLPVTGS